MTRDEFLKELRISLQGLIPQGQVNSQLLYYEQYIIEESRKGRTEEEVLAALGNPRLIAKTIVSVYGNGKYRQDQEEKTQERKNRRDGKVHVHRFRINSWFSGALTAMFLIAVIVLFVRIGMLLLPVLGAAFMLAVMCYFIFLIFFGNKK